MLAVFLHQAGKLLAAFLSPHSLQAAHHALFVPLTRFHALPSLLPRYLLLPPASSLAHIPVPL
jgi:hypothetical protein